MPNPNIRTAQPNGTSYVNASYGAAKQPPPTVQYTPPLHELSFTELFNKRIAQYWHRTSSACLFLLGKGVDTFWWFLYHNWFKIAIISLVSIFLFTKNPLELLENKPTKAVGTRKNLLGSDLNPFAPVSASELNERQAQAYIQRFLPTAIAEMTHFGIPVSIQLAQGLVESRAGTSKLAMANNNHFGLKCFSKSCPKGHCSNFTDDHHKDFFKKYQSPWDSWREHSKLLSNNYYKPLHQVGLNYKKWAAGLQALGYATDPSYEAKLISMIEKYELYKYDIR